MNTHEVINKRFSARQMDPSKKISSEDMQLILEAGIKAPNGYGIESWHFNVVEGDLSKLVGPCYGQAHVANASHAVVLSIVHEDYIKTNNSFVVDKFVTNGFGEERGVEFINMFDGKMNQYFREQIGYAAAQMVLQATDLGIGSVIMGGFLPDQIANIVGIDETMYAPTAVITFGYSTVEKKDRKNRSFDSVVEFTTL